MLARHIERLIGTSRGIGDLNLNLATISSLVLLSERESEIEGSPSAPPERYTHNSFFKDLSEIGLDSYDDVKNAIHDMAAKGYVSIDPKGELVAMKPAATMAKLLDQAFPGMPGMNLVAYLVQTMDEVLSGRKDLETAVSQFDQALKMHSAVLKKEAPKPHGPSGRGRAARQGKASSAQEKADRLSKLLRARQAARRAKPRPQPAGDSVVLSATGSQVEYVEIKEEVGIRKDESAETTPQTSEMPSQPVIGEDDVSHAVPGGEVSEQMSPEPQPSPPLPEAAEQEKGLSTETGLEKTEAGTDQAEAASSDEVQTERETDVISETPEMDLSDEEIEKRIAVLQEDLAMSCPLCPTGKVQQKDTAKGKSFYVCANQDCIFVSWGKPYHLTCPWCKNPFLVESTDNDGNTMLRCPRATCRYRQKPPWEMTQGVEQQAASPLQAPPQPAAPSRKPRRKVVRRRLVRRKR
jgi:hypothetical protein